LPSGSNFTLTFPFNGATILEKGGYEKDLLFLKAKELRDYFIWESHTWAHLYLDNQTYDKVRTEYLLNDFTLLALFDANDTQRIPNYCTRATVTPSITGLFNPAAMRAIFEHGFRFVVGDNSRPALAPPSAYHSLRTNNATNGIEGMYIIPRHATNIYYDGWFSPSLLRAPFVLLYSFTPLLLYSFTPLLLYSFTPLLLYSFTTLLLYLFTPTPFVPLCPLYYLTPSSPSFFLN
jgi:hypothetical protein